MTSRLMELEDELMPADAELAEPEEDEDEDDARLSAASGTRRRSRRRRVARTSAARALGPAPRPAPRPVAGSHARALAAARPIRYRVPGSLPLVSAPGPMNAWAAAVAALLGWRERQVMGIEDALGRLGPRWVDLLHRNHGLPAAEKAAFLAAAGLVADPPVKYEPDDLEMLLRENGPLWVTDDDRGARLFSPKAYLITGIRGTGRREAQLEVVDAATGRGGAMRLSRLMQRLGGPRGRMQVLHMGQGAPNREAPAPEPEPVMQQAIYSSAMNPALIIAGAGLGFQIVKEMLNATPDITVTRARLNGEVNPNDDPSWAGRGDWQKASFPVREGRFENQLSDQQSVDFTVEFQYNGHSLSDIGVKLGATNDAYGWKLSVEQDITIRKDLFDATNNVVAAEIVFTYRHTAPVRNDIVKRARAVVYGDGRYTVVPEAVAESQAAAAPVAAPIIAAAGLTWQVIKDLFNPTPDITITRARLNGKKHPGDDAGWDARGQWQQSSIEVNEGRIENLARDQQSADFKVEYQHNGHSLGNIIVHTTGTNDAFGWKLAVEQDIVIRDDLSTGGENPVVAAEVSFTYRHTAPIRNDIIKRARVLLFADGSARKEALAEGQGLAAARGW